MSDTPKGQKKKVNLWPFLPFPLLSIPFLMLGWLFYSVSGDASHVIEKDYYQKAVNWDQKMAQDEQNERLGWTLELQTRDQPSGDVLLRVELKDGNGVAVPDALVTVEAYAVARSATKLSRELKALDGRHSATLSAHRPGLWNLSFVAQKGDTRFTHSERRDFHLAAAP